MSKWDCSECTPYCTYKLQKKSRYNIRWRGDTVDNSSCEDL